MKYFLKSLYIRVGSVHLLKDTQRREKHLTLDPNYLRIVGCLPINHMLLLAVSFRLHRGFTNVHNYDGCTRVKAKAERSAEPYHMTRAEASVAVCYKGGVVGS